MSFIGSSHGDEEQNKIKKEQISRHTNPFSRPEQELKITQE